MRIKNTKRPDRDEKKNYKDPFNNCNKTNNNYKTTKTQNDQKEMIKN